MFEVQKDTVGKLIKMSKIKGGGSDVSKSTTTLANARRNGAGWEDIAERE
jgi:hypothetical protein